MATMDAAAIEREYVRSYLAEEAFRYYWAGRKQTRSIEEARVWADRITGALDVAPVPTIANPGRLVWEAAPSWWAAYYVPNTGAMMFRSGRIELVILCHELAHHVCAVTGRWDGGKHRKAFFSAEDRIFTLLEKEGKGFLL